MMRDGEDEKSEMQRQWLVNDSGGKARPGFGVPALALHTSEIWVSATWEGAPSPSIRHQDTEQRAFNRGIVRQSTCPSSSHDKERPLVPVPGATQPWNRQ